MKYTIDDKQNMSSNKNDKYGGKSNDWFLHAAQIHDNKHHNKKCNEDKFVFVISYWQKTENGIAAGNQRNGNRQHIVYDQGTAWYYTGAATYSICWYNVSPTAIREIFNDARIGISNDKNS